MFVSRPSSISCRVQEKAFPRQIQAKLELFVAETYGQSQLTLTMKMETFIPSNDMIPNTKIQIVLEPPADTPHCQCDESC